MKKGKRIYLTVLAIVTAIVVVVGLFRACGGSYDDDDWDEKDFKEVTDESVGAFTTLDMDIGAGDVEIVSGDDYHITAQFDDAEFAPVVKQDGNTLAIKQKSINKISAISTRDWAVKVKITVPRDAEIKKIDLDFGAGNLDVTGISCGTFELDFGAGDLEFSGCTLGKLDVDNGAGNIEMNNCDIKTLEIDSGMGDIDIAGIGDPAEYTMEISVGTGDLKIEGLTSAGGFGNDYKQAGTSNKFIDIDLGTGDLEITR